MYLMRLDDATDHWEKSNWIRMHDLMDKYGIKPIIALIPENKDEQILKYPIDTEYDSIIYKWIHVDKWTPGLHGCNHKVKKCVKGGYNPVNIVSEFTGVSLEEQKQKLRKGYKILHDKGIPVDVFVAPAHTFDKNTIQALKEVTPIRIISDTIARDVYYRNGIYYIPQQSGMVRELAFPIVTFCYHPNTMTDSDFEKLQSFLDKHQKEFISFEDVQLRRRSRTFIELLLSAVYFSKLRLQDLLHMPR